MNGRSHHLYQTIQVGDLVQYRSKPGVPVNRIGLVLDIEDIDEGFETYFKILWQPSNQRDRDWYKALEVVKIDQ